MASSSLLKEAVALFLSPSMMISSWLSFHSLSFIYSDKCIYRQTLDLHAHNNFMRPNHFWLCTYMHVHCEYLTMNVILPTVCKLDPQKYGDGSLNYILSSSCFQYIHLSYLHIQGNPSPPPPPPPPILSVRIPQLLGMRLVSIATSIGSYTQ